jgi:hypothetical protein
MEASSNQLETRVFGRDQGVRGLLRVTLAPILATHLLMPDFADFARLHPEIEMEILSIEEPVNLTNREGRRRDPRRLRTQSPAVQSPWPEGTGVVRRGLHFPQPPCRVAWGRI